SKWYEIYLNNESNSTRMGGFSLPGAPGIVIGSNNNISWGITNLMTDDSDFYILQKDKSDRMKYFLDSTYLLMDSTEEAIKVKNETDDHYHTTYTTQLGPVVSGLQRTGFRGERKIETDEEYIVAFKWTGYEYSDEIGAMYIVNMSKDWNE